MAQKEELVLATINRAINSYRFWKKNEPAVLIVHPGDFESFINYRLKEGCYNPEMDIKERFNLRLIRTFDVEIGEWFVI